MKKKILLFIALIVLLVPAFIFLVPVKDGRTVYKNIQYKRLLAGAVQPDNYDKMKISYATIVERKTGTEKFNTPDFHSVDDGSMLSDMNGNDVSDKDNYLRTFDSLQYTVEVGVALNLDNPDVTNTTTLTGGVIKIRGTLPKNDDGMPYLYWVQEPWMKDAKISTDGTVLTASYVFPENSTAVGGNQQLIFNVYASGFPAELTAEQMPKFEIWMEGNKPDNESSAAEKMPVNDSNPVIITGRENYNIRLDGPAIKTNGERNGIKGYYFNFGVNLHMNGLSSNFEYKGMAFPTSRSLANSKIKITYSYSNMDSPNTYQTLTEESEYGIINGTELVAYNKSQYSIENPNAWPTSTSNYLNSCSEMNWDNGVYYHYGCGYIPGKYDSGDISAELTSNIINITNENMINKFYSKSDYTTGMLFVDAIELFVPYLNDGSNHNYKIKVEVIDYSVHGDNYYSQDPKSDNTKEVEFKDYLDGTITAHLDVSSKLSWGDDGYIIQNDKRELESYLYMKDGPYLGGEERLITFNADYYELKPYSNGSYYKFSESFFGADKTPTPRENMTMKYGVYKTNPDVGLNTVALVNSAVNDDFDWYDTVDEAGEHGKVTALLWNNPDYTGGYKTQVVDFMVKDTGKSENFNTVGTMRQKNYVYGDSERQNVYTVYASNAVDSYTPTAYSDLNTYTKATPYDAGESLLVIDDFVRYIMGHVTYGKGETERRQTFNVLDEVIELSPDKDKAFTYINTSGNHYRNIYFDLVEKSPYLTYVPNSCSIEPYQVVENGDQTTITFKIENFDLRENFPQPRCTFEIDPLTPNNTKIGFESIQPRVDNIRYYANDSSWRSITIVNLSGSSTRKIPSSDYIDKNTSFEIVGNVNNISDGALNNVKTIELLPKDGDDRNSVIHGEYLLKVTELAEGMTLYYSTGNIDEIGIETDGLGYKHIQNVDLANDDRWIQVNVGEFIPPEATAIATLTDTIPTQTSKGFTYQVLPSNNQKGDIYYFGQYASSDNLVENIFSTYKSVTVVDRRISGTVFEDLNRNDLLNDTDAKLNNYTVQLLNETGTLLDETTTDSNGHYEFSLPDKGTYYIGVATNIPDGYEIIPKGTTSNSSRFDSTLRSDLIDQTGVAHNAIEEVENINLGIRKKEATLVVKYLDKNDGHALVDQTEETVYYTDNYETHGLTTIPENYSFLENAGDPVADVVNKDYIEVIYYYDFTPATITAKHYIDGTSNKIHEDVIQNSKLTKPYSTEQLDTTNLNYEYVRTDGDATSGTVGKTNIVVNYYYKLKTGTVTTHHYLYDNGETTTILAPDVTKEWNYTDTYTTSVSNEVPANYEFYKKSDNYTAVMGSPSVEVKYYYRLKDSSLTTSIEMAGTEEITSKDSNVDYTITYNAKVVDYIGNGTIAINATLPYEIDVDNSNLDGGTYDATDKSISWVVDWSDIDTYAGRDETTITKTISVKYNGIVGRDRVMTANAHGNILLSNSSRDAEAQTSTNIRINGNIKVIYIDKDTQEEILDAIEETNLVGEQFISEAKEKDGYKLISSPDSETFEFEEEDQLVTYGYEHIKFEIKGKVLGVGGKIRGDEDVYWGDDSTAGNIIVEADDGYIIEAILVNGERLDIEPGQVTLVLENFKEVLENKNIEVIFAKKPQENPNTKAFIGLIILISWLILFTNAILLKKSQELE